VEGYLTLFLAAFLAATIVPMWSEVLFAGLLASGHDPLWLWAWASVGNTLGAGVNWAFARWALHWQDRRWFPFKKEQLGRAQGWFQRYGVWSLLFAWLPVGGDALTFVAGLMKVRWPVFFALTFVGKATRYAILLAALAGASHALGAGS
jgi:membrane protein YqaA with SNARE-associated domain